MPLYSHDLRKRVIDTVERWLEERAAGSVELWLGEHSYRIARSAPAETWQ